MGCLQRKGTVQGWQEWYRMRMHQVISELLLALTVNDLMELTYQGRAFQRVRTSLVPGKWE